MLRRQANLDTRHLGNPEPVIPEDRTTQIQPPSESDSRAERVLFVNGDRQAFTPPCTVTDLLETLEMSGRRVAVAVNRNVVVRSRYQAVELAAGDRIEILEAVGGG